MDLDQAQIITTLKIDPELWVHAEEGAESESDLGVDRALALDNLVDGGARNASAAGKLALTELVSIQKFLLKQAAGSGGYNGFLFAGHGGDDLVVVGDFNFKGVPTVPTEAEPPLIVDADAVVTGAASLEDLQSVAGWDAQGVELGGGVEKVELGNGAMEKIRGEMGPLALPELFRFFIAEAFDHGQNVLHFRTRSKWLFYPLADPPFISNP